MIRHLGGGILYLDPTSFDGAQDHEYWRRQFEDLIPFLTQQSYLEEVRIYEGEAFDIDLDAYLRTTHGTPGDRTTIVANHFIGLGLKPPDEFSPWLSADSTVERYPVVVHRSQRYHGLADYSFLSEFTGDVFCVGSPGERAAFEEMGARSLVKRDIRELAEVINSCAVFIGNQSLPLALAAGIGRPRMVEESARLPNATFGVSNEAILTSSPSENRKNLDKLLKWSERGHGSPARTALAAAVAE